MNQYIAIMSRKDGGTRITLMADSLTQARKLVSWQYPGVKFDWVGVCPTLKGRAGQSLLPR